MKSGNCFVLGKYCVSLDNHHIIPEQYGGEKGPTVLLRPDIHQTIHRCVNNPELKSNFMSMVKTQGNSKSAVKVSRLIESIIQAKLSFKENLIQKKKSIAIEIHPVVYNNLKIKATEYKVSVKKIIEDLVNSMFKR